MELYHNNFYHIYNRSNNKEKIFKERRNYNFFLEKYSVYLKEHLETIAYCLMPTHFHLLVKIISTNTANIKNIFGTLLSSYTKAINKAYDRHGGLFQSHTKAKQIDQESQLKTIITYIHQNPLRAGLVKQLDEWEFSSYRDILSGNSNITNVEFIKNLFGTKENFVRFSREMIEQINKKYWVSKT